MNFPAPISSTSTHPPWLSWPLRCFARSPLWLKVALGATLTPAIFTPAAWSAERIYIAYGPLERSISISSLETYAREGRLERDLAAYSRYTTPERMADLQNILLARADLSPVAVSQFLYTDQGEILLRRLGQVIQTESRQPGFYALRSALILAAADPDGGLTPLNVLQKFPVRSLRVDLEQAFQIIGSLEQLINQTSGAIAAIERQSAIEAAAEPTVTLNQLPDLRSPGDFRWDLETVTLFDGSRNRLFLTDIYLPLTDNPGPAPVIVISHGLGSDRSTYAYLARHLASYGFVVAVPEHPGSNAEQLQALISGRASEVTPPIEFIDRPLDVQYLLDVLEQLTESDPKFRGRMNLQQVGVLGQSFGGYTALALAGAQLNFNELAADCRPNDSLNISLLLQCRALELQTPISNFRDPRVKAAIAINPIGSSLLGPEGFSQIDIPVMIVSGSADTVAPALLEQIQPFTWLNTPNKYLLMIQGATHFSTLGQTDTGSEIVVFPSEVIGPDPSVAQGYIKAMGVAFFGTHVANQAEYRPFLGAAYARAISEDLLPLNLARFLTAMQLAEALEDTSTAKTTALRF